MKKSRIIFFSVFAAYQLIVVLFTWYIQANRQDIGVLFKLLRYVSVFVYGALFGLLLTVVDLVWTWRSNKINKASEEALRRDNNVLKAKIYDFQESNKGAKPVTPPEGK